MKYYKKIIKSKIKSRNTAIYSSILLSTRERILFDSTDIITV